MAHYTIAQLTQAAYNAGFRGTSLVTAVAISLAENRQQDSHAVNHNPNGTVDRGAWQINSAHNFAGNPYNLQTNANQAYRVYRSQGFTAWTTYNNGEFRMFQNQALKTAAAGHHFNTGGKPTISNLAGTAGNAALNAFDPLNPIDQALHIPGSNIISDAQAVPKLAAHLLSPSFWRSVGIIAGATLLIIFGFALILESNKTVRSETVKLGETAAMA